MASASAAKGSEEFVAPGERLLFPGGRIHEQEHGGEEGEGGEHAGEDDDRIGGHWNLHQGMAIPSLRAAAPP